MTKYYFKVLNKNKDELSKIKSTFKEFNETPIVTDRQFKNHVGVTLVFKSNKGLDEFFQETKKLGFSFNLTLGD